MFRRRSINQKQHSEECVAPIYDQDKNQSSIGKETSIVACRKSKRHGIYYDMRCKRQFN